MSARSRSTVGTAIGVVLLLGAWAALARRQPELILPSPLRAWEALVALAQDGVVAKQLATTLWRAVTGVLIALVLGSVWGGFNGRFPWVLAVTQPALSSLMALPPVALVAVGMVWFGPGDAVARLVIAAVALPLIVVAVQEAIVNLDRDLLEMAQVFAMPRWLVLRHLVIPGIASPVVAALSITLGQALRVTVMVELLAAANGVGAEVARSRANLSTANLFAWVILLVGVVLVIEVLILRPVTNWLLRWRTAPLAKSSPSQPAQDQN